MPLIISILLFVIVNYTMKTKMLMLNICMIVLKKNDNSIITYDVIEVIKKIYEGNRTLELIF